MHIQRRGSRLHNPRFRRYAVGGAALLALAGLNAPATLGFAAEQYHRYEISRPEYRARYGSWEILRIPERFRVNAIHAALLRTGKVLIVAGSGNNERQFRAGSFRTVLWDPGRNSYSMIETPADLFCGGHAQLPDGRVLVAGGTLRYEVLADRVTRAGGVLRVRNEDPNRGRTFPKGTVLTSEHTRTAYRSTAPVTLPPARKTTGRRGRVTVTATEQEVFAEAVKAGRGQIVDRPEKYRIKGLHGSDRHNLYAMGEATGFKKQDYQGLKVAYEFNPDTERYEQVNSMEHARWYPTLVGLPDGRVLAVSGLDGAGRILEGQNEVYDPARKRWRTGPTHYFPTYPALFLTGTGKLFYSGMNAGYGPARKGRTPGIWDLRHNTFSPVPGLRRPALNETGASVLLPPAQRQRVMVLGGGGVGESARSTGRTDIVDLSAAKPGYRPGPDLPAGGTRYLNSVLLPDDTVFTSHGSADYRGRRGSDLMRAQIYHPRGNRFTEAAEPLVGRNYHSGALLLPDGRVLAFGSDPLFADRAGTVPGSFEQRIEIYRPSYLHRGPRPRITAAPRRLALGGTGELRTTRPGRLREARLIRPGAVTHVTDVEQRSVALKVRRTAGGLRVTVPGNPALLPPGWYLLTVTDDRGIPSKARWVRIAKS